jgi:chromosome segregation ATPase
MINLKNAEEYLKKILATTYDNIDIMFRKSRNKYEDLISKFGNNMHHKNDPKNIQEMKEYINNLVKYLKKYFIPIVSYKMFNFDPNLSNKINKYIINKLNFLVENISYFEENEKNNVQKKIDEYNKMLIEKDSQGINLEQSIRDLKNKEREYLNLLEIEKKRYETLEKYFHSSENENQKKMNDSQNKLNELIKENYNLKNKKLTSNDDFSLNGIKSDYSFVRNKLNEYKNTIINFNNLINLNLQSNPNAFDQGIQLLNTNFEKLINNNFNDLYEYKEKATKYKNELDKVNFEMNKLKIELKEEQQKFILLKKQFEDEQKNYDLLLSLFNQQKSLISAQEEKIKLQLS